MLRVKLFMSIAMTLSVLSTAVRAESVPLLVNQTTGATIFDDNFENATVGLPPVATTGTWTVGEGTPTTYVPVLSDAWGWAGGGPGPNQGTQMLGFTAEDGTSKLLGQGIAANSGSNHVVKLNLAFRIAVGTEISVYATGAGADLLQIGLFGPAAASEGFANNSVRVVDSTGMTWLDTGFAADPNAWNTLTVTHTNETTAWAISVNGSPEYATTGYALGVSTAWDGLRIHNDLANVTGYFDAVAVPEPSVMVSLAIGLFGLLAYAWRKRK